MTGSRRKQPAQDDKGGDIQGEGDYRSAREFNEDEREFVRSHDVERLAEEARPENPQQAEEMERAERAGKARARPDPETDQDTKDASADEAASKPSNP